MKNIDKCFSFVETEVSLERIKTKEILVVCQKKNEEQLERRVTTTATITTGKYV